MNGLLVLGTPFDVLVEWMEVEGDALRKLTYAAPTYHSWQIKLMCLSRSVFHTTIEGN
ncbi:hypothetical protein [Paenibacillus etheri]|uniref:hypothetical protein n=1 Tax=Paenibacillus etheri TaxID=1306852 RepID=UPI000A8C0E54|nr:hypothetical protein [Paenibacillus etheri]